MARFWLSVQTTDSGKHYVLLGWTESLTDGLHSIGHWWESKQGNLVPPFARKLITGQANVPCRPWNQPLTPPPGLASPGLLSSGADMTPLGRYVRGITEVYAPTHHVNTNISVRCVTKNTLFSHAQTMKGTPRSPILRQFTQLHYHVSQHSLFLPY